MQNISIFKQPAYTAIVGMSNTDHPANKHALIDDGINPLRCHFDAYKGKGVFRDVRIIYVIMPSS